MKTLSILLTLITLSMLTLNAESTFETQFAQQVSAFLNTLDDEQSEECLHKLDDPLRWKMQYTGGKRAGIAIGKLNREQRKAFEKTIRLVLSAEGWDMAKQVIQQDGNMAIKNYYVACFGDPRHGEDFAFRLAEHHLTIIHLSVRDGKADEFGPILLGANPPTLWKKDEKALLKLWKDAQDPSLLIQGKKAIASEAMPKGDGTPYAELNSAAQQQLQTIWNLRLRIFTPQIQSILNQHLQYNGGIKAANIAFYNKTPLKRCEDGGKWDFNCQIGKLHFDYEGSRGHIHFSLWLR
ncbi:DUF3500 domain-containing protein [Rubritalea marina]|uniref:DUF3500 domain-containing protein n=1 Tax=Rubritalea marina TaxID=361055 RepID=UPI0014615FF5|nr:DUF3500 domain-containing protein [Rubritalea marina]